jgi:hypothetical protein
MVEFADPTITPGTLVHCRVSTRPVNGVCKAELWPSWTGTIDLSGADPSLLHWWCLAEIEEDTRKARFIAPVVDSGVTLLQELEIRELLRFDLANLHWAMDFEQPEASELWNYLGDHLPLVITDPMLRLDPIKPDWAAPGLAMVGGLLYEHSSSLLGISHLWDAIACRWVATPPASVGLDFGGDEVLWLRPPWKAHPHGSAYASRISSFDTRGLKALLIRDESGTVVTRRPSPAQPAPRDLSVVEQQADAGDRQAQYELGLEYEKGERLERDSGQALKWFSKAAEQWHGEALWKVGQAYLEGIPGVAACDPARAATWIKRAADKDIAEAFFPLGELYRVGVGVEQDLSRARDCYRTAGHKGNARGMLLAGQMFARGEGGEACFASAVWFLSRAADEHGLEEAELELGYVYQSRGDVEQAQQWFQRAAEHGSREAAQQLE